MENVHITPSLKIIDLIFFFFRFLDSFRSLFKERNVLCRVGKSYEYEDNDWKVKIFFMYFAGKHNVYRMSASTAEEKDEWIRCIRYGFRIL